MSDIKRPQDFHPDLTEDRLAILGEIVAAYHNSAIRAERQAEGDGPWSTGCRAYDRVKSGVRGAGDYHPWLMFQSEGSLSFWLCVGMCPMRICKQEQRPVVREGEQLAIQKMAEQLPLAAPGLGIPLEAALRVEKQIVGRLVRTVLLNLVSQDGETVYKSWEIYQVPDAGQVLVPGFPPPPPHDPGRAAVSPKRPANADDDSVGASEPDA